MPWSNGCGKASKRGLFTISIFLYLDLFNLTVAAVQRRYEWMRVESTRFRMGQSRSSSAYHVGLEWFDTGRSNGGDDARFPASVGSFPIRVHRRCLSSVGASAAAATNAAPDFRRGRRGGAEPEELGLSFGQDLLSSAELPLPFAEDVVALLEDVPALLESVLTGFERLLVGFEGGGSDAESGVGLEGGLPFGEGFFAFVELCRRVGERLLIAPENVVRVGGSGQWRLEGGLFPRSRRRRSHRRAGSRRRLSTAVGDDFVSGTFSAATGGGGATRKHEGRRRQIPAQTPQNPMRFRLLKGFRRNENGRKGVVPLPLLPAGKHLAAVVRFRLGRRRRHRRRLLRYRHLRPSLLRRGRRGKRVDAVRI